MKIFISSLIRGYEPFRAAARTAVAALGHEPIMAEDFGALTTSPQIACLQGLRSSDLVVLILVDKYGYAQGTSGISPTQEEYAEARGAKNVLVFVQEGVERDPEQATFVTQVQEWETGHYRAGFQTADELRDRITQAVHQYEISNAAGPIDTSALTQAATKMLPKGDERQHMGSAMAYVSFVAGPSQLILRPAQLEAQALSDAIHQRALFGEPRLFDRSKGVNVDIEGSALVLEQEGGARIQLDERGSMLLRVPLDATTQRSRQNFGAFESIIQERVVGALRGAIAFADWCLEQVDATARLTHVAVAAALEASEHAGWRTQAEQDANVNSVTMGWGAERNRTPVAIDVRRGALRFQGAEMAEDLMVPLRRQWKTKL